MAYPMLENALFDTYWLDGNLISSESEKASSLKEPVSDITYYETVRIKHGVMLYLEDHLKRLEGSVKAKENFSVNKSEIASQLREYLEMMRLGRYEGNIRIVLTKNHRLYHICEANIPGEDIFRKGIATTVINWERVEPNVKVFRGDYKRAVAEGFSRTTQFGKPYEVLLSDNNDKLTEGSKSNFFAIVDGTVYSADDCVILIGITRNRVLEALNSAGAKFEIGTFSLKELSEFKDEGRDVALFVSSTPFDILPISSVDDVKFDSVNNAVLRRISDIYLEETEKYIMFHG